MSAGGAAWDDAAILCAIEGLVREHLDRDVTLHPDQRLAEILELDSIRLLTLVVEVENRFRICLDEHDDAGLDTVGDLLEAIRRRR
jgi:acyl carrier protein